MHVCHAFTHSIHLHLIHACLLHVCAGQTFTARTTSALCCDASSGTASGWSAQLPGCFQSTTFSWAALIFQISAAGTTRLNDAAKNGDIPFSISRWTFLCSTAGGVFNWEHGTSTPMTHKAFILSVAIDGLKQVDPINAGVYDPSPAAPQPDVLSPAAMATPPAPRFQCKKQQLGSIAKAKHYK